MTVATTTSRKSVVGDGTTNAINFPYNIHAASEMKVYLVDDDGEQTLKTQGADYDIELAEDFTSCDVTPKSDFAAEADGLTILLDRTLPYTQALELVTNPRLDSREMEKALDRGAMRDQQLDTRVGEMEEAFGSAAAAAASAEEAAETLAATVVVKEQTEAVKAAALEETEAVRDAAIVAQEAAEAAQAGAEAARDEAVAILDLDAADVPSTPAGGLAATNVQDALNELDTEKAPLASPVLTGNPTAPTQSAGDNSTKIATTAHVSAAIAALVASSPAALDTLNELAAALGNDANFAATVTAALAAKESIDAHGIFEIDRQAPSGTGTVTFTIPSGYKRLSIDIKSLRSSAGTNRTFRVEVSDDGGSTWKNIQVNTLSFISDNVNGSSYPQGLAAAATPAGMIGFITSSTYWYGLMEIADPSTASKEKVMRWAGANYQGGNGTVWSHSATLVTASMGAINKIRLSLNADNFNGTEFTVWGVK